MRRWIILGGMVAVFLGTTALWTGCARHHDSAAQGQTAKAAKYHCPMHPSYVSDKPGDCPICNMRLVPMTDSGAGKPPAAPASMNDPQTGATPAAAAVPASGERKILYYRNPMNPEVTSPVPMKDEMGMDYVPVYSDEAPAAASTVPGYSAVTLTPEKIQLAGVQTAPAEGDAGSRTVRTVGSVTADETRVRHVTTKISGYVEKLYVNFTGQAVRLGEPVLALYSPELYSSQQELLRAKETADRFAASPGPDMRREGQDLLDASRKRLTLFDVPESFVREIEESGSPQRDVTLLAPVSGFVTAKGITEGAEVQPGEELYTITDLSQVWIEAQIYEYEAPFVHLGQPAVLTLTYDPSVRLEGTIAFVSPTLDPESRTLTVRFNFANPDLVLKPGMYANVELEIPGGEGVTVPDDAVLDTGTRQIVFVDKGGGTFEPREVRLGMRSGGTALLLSGLSEGERVVVRANFLLDSESRLRAAASTR